MRQARRGTVESDQSQTPHSITQRKKKKKKKKKKKRTSGGSASPKCVARRPRSWRSVSLSRIADVVPALKLRRDTANHASLDVPCTDQPVHRVEAPSASWEFLPTVAVLVEQDRVEADLATVCREHDQACGKSGLGAGVVVQPDRGEALSIFTSLTASINTFSVAINGNSSSMLADDVGIDDKTWSDVDQ